MKITIIIICWAATMAFAYFIGARTGYVCGWKDRGYKKGGHIEPLQPWPRK